jgi:deoxyribodipyrimidine photolyase
MFFSLWYNIPIKRIKDIAMKNSFFSECSRRLHQGAAEYGNSSFFESSEDLTREINEELLDVANWAAIFATTVVDPRGRQALGELCLAVEHLSVKLQECQDSGIFEQRDFSKHGDTLAQEAEGFLCDFLDKNQ